MQIKRISLTKVLKLELPELINDVLRIVDNHEPKGLCIQHMYDRLAKQQPLMTLLEVPQNAHPLTEKVHNLREKEVQYAGAIVSHMNFIARADIECMRSATEIAMPTVKRYLMGVRKNNESVTSQIIHQFLQQLNKKPEVDDALTELGLKPFVDEMRKVHVERKKTLSLRGYPNSKRLRVDSKLIQKNGQDELRLMFKGILVSQFTHSKLNYHPLIKELNELLTRYLTIINTRKTHNKNKSIMKVDRGDNTTPENDANIQDNAV